jgi:DNA repair protein RadC
LQTYKLLLVRESAKRYPGENRVIKGPADVVPVLQEYFKDLDREHFVVIAIGVRGSIIGMNTVSIGSLNASIVHPREVFKFAILANADSIILAHNHPSGIPEPSAEDGLVNQRIVDAGVLMEIKVLDHIIVAGDQYAHIDCNTATPKPLSLSPRQ